MTKTTLATLKSFIKKNESQLFIRVQSSFDGMVDGCTSERDLGFNKAQKADIFSKHNLGFKGVWIVGGSRNFYYQIEENGFKGIRVSNCCGCFIVAIPI